MKEKVLVIIKPDGVYKQIVPEVLKCFYDTGLKLIGIKTVQVPKKLAQAHYGHLKTKFFFGEIVNYLTGTLHGGSAVVACVFEGADAIAVCRRVAGATNPEEASASSVRGKYGRITTKGVYENLVHVSSDKNEAARELKLWFKKSELIEG